MKVKRKKCFKCSDVLPLSNFYAHSRMADGHLNKCKECTKSDVRFTAKVNRVERAAYERDRFQTPKRKAQVKKARLRAREREPQKYKARNAVSNAIRDGRLRREPCEICGDEKSQAHHSDYSKLLEVQWLCFAHHREIEHGQVTNA